MARPDKQAAVADIAERFNDSDAALLTEYRGLRVSEIAEVRTALRESDTDYKVLKNTLARLAVREVGLEELVDMLTGPTAIAVLKGDAAAAAKALDEAAKRFPVLAIKGGVLNGKVIDADQARALAKLETREVLLTRVAMIMNAPAQQTVNVFAALLRDLGSMLAQVVAKKESGELPGGTGEPEAAAELEAAAEPEAAADTAPVPPESDQPGDAADEGAGETTAPAETPDPTGESDQPGDAAADVAEAGPADVAAEEAPPAAEVAEAVDQAPAAPESDAAEEQEVSDESGSKEEE